MKMYLKYVIHQIKISLQYRGATFMMMFVSFFFSLGTLLSFYLLFQTFDNINGYTLETILITFSIVLLVISISELIFRGFDTFEDFIITGDLDKLLIRPRSIFLQVLGSKMEFGRIGRLILGITILIFACLNSNIIWDISRIITLILMIIDGVFIYLGVFLLTSSVNIFTIKGNEFVNIFTHGARDMASYPLDIYHSFFKNLFTFFIPFATFNYLPLKYLLGDPNATILGNMLAPLYGILFVIPCILIFNWALKKYNSSGN